MVIGLVGLAVMAIPALGRHGAGPAGHGHAALGHHGAAGHALPAHGHVAAPAHGAGPTVVRAPMTALEPAQGRELLPADAATSGVGRWLPSPRAAFTVLALYGAFGNALVEAFHLSIILAALVAVIPTLLVERLAVRPLWNLLFRFQGKSSGRLEELIFGEARAVTAFVNGRGIVSTNREGRLIQLRARLCDAEATLPVKVGARLRIEDVDAARERITVSILPEELDS
ncbi:MAG TPA: hypothetical protein VGL86_15945 [Polyangia bacterium]